MRTIILSLVLILAMATTTMAMPYATISKAESGETITSIYSDMQYDVIRNQWIVLDEDEGGVWEEDEVAVVLHTNGATVTDPDEHLGELGLLIVDGEDTIAGVVWLSTDDHGRVLFTYEQF